MKKTLLSAVAVLVFMVSMGFAWDGIYVSSQITDSMTVSSQTFTIAFSTANTYIFLSTSSGSRFYIDNYWVRNTDAAIDVYIAPDNTKAVTQWVRLKPNEIYTEEKFFRNKYLRLAAGQAGTVTIERERNYK